MRLIIYSLFTAGGVLVVLALAVVFFGGEDLTPIEPQSPSVDLSSTALKAAPKVVLDSVTEKSGQAQDQSTEQSLGKFVETGLEESSGASTLTIEIARVKPDGASLFAGKAEPGARIRVFEEKLLLGETTADANGEWVVVLEQTLGAGQHLVSIAMERGDGSKDLAGQSLAIEVNSDMKSKPLVALLPQTATEVPVLLQSPDDVVATKSTATSATSSASGKQVRSVQPTAIVWQGTDKVIVSGNSVGGVRLNVTVTKAGAAKTKTERAVFGEAQVLADGTWQLAGRLDKDVLRQELTFELIDSANNITATYQLPVRARDLAKGGDGASLVIVNEGDALWRIAYRSFGEGVRYVDIVRRNRLDIQNPDLIYPKQIFAIPK